MGQKLLAAIMGLLFLFGASMASATLITYSGSWSTQTTTNPTELPGPYGGSFSFSFDDSSVTGSGFEDFIDLSLISFSWDGVNYGSFDLSTVGGFLIFTDGNLEKLGIGGLISDSNAVAAETDDFLVAYDSLGAIDITAYACETCTEGVHDGVNNSGSASAVPEPTTLALLSLGLVGLGVARKKKKT